MLYIGQPYFPADVTLLTGTEVAGHEATNLNYGTTGDYFEGIPNGSGVVEVYIDLQSNYSSNWIGIAKHNLVTLGATITVYGSGSVGSWNQIVSPQSITDGTVWNPLNDLPATVEEDHTIIITYATVTHRYLKIKFSSLGTNHVKIGALASNNNNYSMIEWTGASLANFEDPLYAFNDVYQMDQSDDTNYMPKRYKYSTFRSSITIPLMDPSVPRNISDPIVFTNNRYDHLVRSSRHPFFLTTYVPDLTGYYNFNRGTYCWCTSPIRVSHTHPDKLSITYDIEGFS